MANYYNEYDPYVAQWLRNLIAAGHIAPGDVDERSIEDVIPNDLLGYTQCHFFAGIGGWPLALRLAGWPDDRPVWTASCPCQPFSAAGKGEGFADERHLWPSLYHLIVANKKRCEEEKRVSPKIYGEQVASKNADSWIDLVHADLEAVGYSFGCVPFPSASIGAPHNRERCYWMADADTSIGRTEKSNRNIRNWTAPERYKGHRNPWQRLHDADWQSYAASISAFPDGDSRRVGELRAYGNAINIEQAKIFIDETMML